LKRGTRLKRFTPEEDALLIELRLVHYGKGPGRPWGHQAAIGGLRIIAAKLGRDKSSIQWRLRVLAARDELWQF
jgi:hypothetical protein